MSDHVTDNSMNQLNYHQKTNNNYTGAMNNNNNYCQRQDFSSNSQQYNYNSNHNNQMMHQQQYNQDHNHNTIDSNSSIPIKIVEATKNVNPNANANETKKEELSFQQTLADDPYWQEPSQSLVNEMVELLDKYFSDENLMKDKFLLKHVRRNKAGYVSVKLLTSFKKLKYLSKTDWRVTAYAISKSRTLELNHSGTKVRRLQALPEINMPTTSIKMLLIKLPDSLEGVFNPDANNNNNHEEFTNYGIENISPKLSGFGRLNSCKIVRPGEGLPAELRNHVGKHLELGTRYCAVVEFEKTEDCQVAHRVLSRNIRALKLAREKSNVAIETTLLIRGKDGSVVNPDYQHKQNSKENQSSGDSIQIPTEQKSPEITIAAEITSEKASGDATDNHQLTNLTLVEDEMINNPEEQQIEDEMIASINQAQEENKKFHMKLQLPESIKLEDIEGWQVCLLGSGRNPRRATKPGPPGKMGRIRTDSEGRTRQASDSSSFSMGYGFGYFEGF